MPVFDTVAHTVLCNMSDRTLRNMLIFQLSRNDDLNVPSWAPFALRSKLYGVLATTDHHIYLCSRTIPH